MEIKLNNPHGTVWLRLAAVYFVVGVWLGIYMGASGDRSLYPVHAHLNLLGWVSMALFGILFRKFPAMGASPLARIQFWLYNLGLPLLMLAVAAIHRGFRAMEPVAGVASIVLGIAVLLFALNVFRNAGN